MIVQHNGIVMVIERRWWHVRLTFEIDGVVGQETSIQWSGSGEGACITAGIELGIRMSELATVDALVCGRPLEPYRYQLKFMEWGPADVDEESP